jgi:hypothetical protein
MKTAYRTSISLSPHLGGKLKEYKNKSKVIEKALELFFDYELFFKKEKKKYLKNMKKKYEKGESIDKKNSITHSLLGTISETDFSPESYEDYLLNKHL